MAGSLKAASRKWGALSLGLKPNQKLEAEQLSRFTDGVDHGRWRIALFRVSDEAWAL